MQERSSERSSGHPRGPEFRRSSGLRSSGHPRRGDGVLESSGHPRRGRSSGHPRPGTHHAGEPAAGSSGLWVEPPGGASERWGRVSGRIALALHSCGAGLRRELQLVDWVGVGRGALLRALPGRSGRAAVRGLKRTARLFVPPSSLRSSRRRCARSAWSPPGSAGARPTIQNRSGSRRVLGPRDRGRRTRRAPWRRPPPACGARRARTGPRSRPAQTTRASATLPLGHGPIP